jgi:multisubunit Na+/H+ antiporter MnhB subunit
MTMLLGIPIPSTNPIFVAIVAIHILFGLAAISTGATAMLSRKARGRHSNFGIAYFWCLFGVFVTMSVLAFARWQEDYDLFILGALSFGAAWLGRTILRRRWRQWPRWHLASMGASFVLMITAFYVDNGKNLPLWRELPQIAFWFLPAVIGTPIVLYVLRTHPLVLAYDRVHGEVSNPDAA